MVLNPTQVITKTENVVADSWSITSPIRDLNPALTQTVTSVLVTAQHPVIHHYLVTSTAPTESVTTI